jgi:hypothetical protein
MLNVIVPPNGPVFVGVLHFGGHSLCWILCLYHRPFCLYFTVPKSNPLDVHPQQFGKEPSLGTTTTADDNC